MFPWIREPIAELWHGRKNSRTTLDPSKQPRNSQCSSNDDMVLLESGTSDSFLIKIIGLEGSVVPITVRSHFTIQNVKSIAVTHFYGDDTSSSNFRLIHTTKIKKLADDQTLQNEGVTESDELLLVDSVQSLSYENEIEIHHKGPTINDIYKATVNLPLSNYATFSIPKVNHLDMQAELCKILITLVKASAKILMYSPEAPKLYEILKERLEARYRPLNDPKAVKDLTDMGFSEKKVIKALRIKKVNVAEALEWLIDDEDNTDEEDLELPTLNENLDSDCAGPSSSGAPANKRKKSLKEACKNLVKKDGTEESNLIYIVELLLESFRQYKKLNFKPNPKILEDLYIMGFEKKYIIEALQATGNYYKNACEWLLGERDKSLQDLDEGLDPESPVYEAIMSNSYIRLSLNNSKIFLAFLSILETPSSANTWDNDPDVSPVLNQIFRTFQPNA